MASGRNGTIYISVTSDLAKRTWEHREGVIPGFTSRYGCKTLVWHKSHDDIQDARNCERQMKKWNRIWKLDEIEKMNPDWDDLFESIA